MFQTLLASSCFQAGKKNKEKKPQRRKKNVEKGGSLPSRSHLALSLLVPTSSLLFLPFRFKRFLLGIFFYSSKRKKGKTQRKKNHRKEKKCKERRECTFLLSFVHLGWSAPLAISSPHSFTVELSTFLTSPQSFVLLKLGSSLDLWK